MLQRSRTPINVDNIIFKTPRRLVHSLQESNNVNSDFSEKQTRRFRSLSLSEFDCSPNARYNQNGYSHGVNYDCRENGSFYGGGEQFQGSPESVSSTDGIPKDADLQASHDMVPEIKTEIQRSGIKKPLRKAAVKLFCGLSLALLAVVVPLALITDQGQGHEGYFLVPT